MLVFPLRLISLSMAVGVKWWVCRGAPIFDAEALTQNLYVYCRCLSSSLAALALQREEIKKGITNKGIIKDALADIRHLFSH